MDSEEEPPKTLTKRHKCSACFKQYKKKEHLVAHMKTSFHSVHQPKCDGCQKHCKSLESLREHITGPLPKANCSKIFSLQGCDLCLRIFDGVDSRDEHRKSCQLAPATPTTSVGNVCVESEIDTPSSTSGKLAEKSPKAIAIDCEMVGGGSDGSIDVCARVCLVDEDENQIFHTYVLPQIPVTDYRFEVTGLTEEQLREGMSLKEVQDKINEILYNGETIGRIRLGGGKARLLVGHDLEHDLNCLEMNYPDHLLRDTAKYRPLMKTNLISHSLKYLAKTYLGYDIQSGAHDPYEDSVAAMRLYKRMRSQEHPVELLGSSEYHTQSFISVFDLRRPKELEKMTPDELYEMSRSNYRCWCLDSKQVQQEKASSWGAWTMRCIDKVLNLSEVFDLESPEPGVLLAVYIFSIAWQLADASLDDEGLSDMSIEPKSKWPTCPQEMEIDGDGCYSDKKKEGCQGLHTTNTSMAIEVINELLQNKVVNRIMYLVRENMSSHWGGFTQRMQLLSSKSAMFQNSKYITPEVLLGLSSDTCEVLSPDCKGSSQKQFHAVMSSGSLLPSAGQSQGVSSSALWLPIEIFLEGAMDGSQVPFRHLLVW